METLSQEILAPSDPKPGHSVDHKDQIFPNFACPQCFVPLVVQEKFCQDRELHPQDYGIIRISHT